ncbi:polysaccharide lyase family 7 protein [Actinoplanes sp. NPDC024001]|uniref:polysaccharide lyase family 7 protein n=1 Tax=Actinoplanes sp. NPDC024001 TaxID=3154598 RepID=UPI0033DE80C0
MTTTRKRALFTAHATAIGLIAMATFSPVAAAAGVDAVESVNPRFGSDHVDRGVGRPKPTPAHTSPHLPGGRFDPAVWDDSEAGDYVRSSKPYVLNFDGLKTFTVTGNGGGPRDELKTPQDARKASDEIYESLSADITFNLDDGVKLIAQQIHAGSGAGFSTQFKLYVQDSSALGIFKGEGEENFALDDYPRLEGVPSNGVFDVYARVQIPGSVSGDGEINEKIFDLGTIKSGDTIKYKFINDHGVVAVRSVVGRNKVKFTYDMADSAASYMKFGSYVQAQDAESGCNVTNDLDCEYPGWEPYGESDNVEKTEELWRQYFSDSHIGKARVTFRNLVHVGGPLQ